jgi:transposase InsO family protein
MNHHITTHAQRVEIVQRHATGESYHNIAHDLRLNYYTVRAWCRRYRKAGWEGLKPRALYTRQPLLRFHPLVKYGLLKLKRQHPGWGLDKLRLELQRRSSLRACALPKRSTLHTYLKQFYPRLREHRPLPTQRPAHGSPRAQAVHEQWQIDFKGEYRFTTIGAVKPLNICDEFSSAPLASIIHSGQRGAVTMRHVQQDLRHVFTQWGLPDGLRMDRDPTWVGSSRLEFPSFLMLWLVGLGIQPIVNRPHHPTDNAQIERCNGIWVEQIGRGASPDSYRALQTMADAAWQDRRDFLPSRNPHCAGLPPTQALPALLVPRRSFSALTEAELFDMQRVDTYLTQWRWQRQVDSTGQISLGGCNRRVSKQHAGQVVSIRLEVVARHFAVQSVDGQALASFVLPILDPSFILGTGSSLLDTS